MTSSLRLADIPTPHTAEPSGGQRPPAAAQVSLVRWPPMLLDAAARTCDQVAEDWDVLFPALLERLQPLRKGAPAAAAGSGEASVAGSGAASGAAHDSVSDADAVPGGIDDCRLALQQLHGLFVQERTLRRRFQAELKLALAAKTPATSATTAATTPEAAAGGATGAMTVGPAP